jgi:hypothetical protein
VGFTNKIPACSVLMLSERTSLLVSNGYVPYAEAANGGAWTRLDPEQSIKWQPTNVLWRHRAAPNIK